MAELDLEELNKVQRYTQWAVFRTAPGALGEQRAQAAKQVQGFLDALAEEGKVTVRGVYLASGFKADADFVIWWHAQEFDELQAALNAFRKETTLGLVSELVWCGNGLHRPSEFNKSHLPSFIMGEEAERWMTVYPFVRSYDWYVLDPADRRRILAEHGRAAAGFKDVRANTTAAFALGDYEWMLAFEAGSMDRIVDLMHTMRYTEARLHVREEVPFYSGRRVESAEELLTGLA
ncbi:chlorite dismutase family protein [Corynebacterium sp. zg-331]|uniref:hydrogen peroxide-dependent heme synthase n=1 Tax=unclassified Corynebacterium TaxID=2624378 RepID=UPI00128C7EE3|nr:MULTISPECIES: hydrogen peroxide-dependent heme synthase [unclassified Corynebacterium]MBC3185429.1 chlorite dismutase family protein [Corynebacterium sp. zg-331]MPV51924.1 hypothetical protein [Corynebacterium sp. zg331]